MEKKNVYQRVLAVMTEVTSILKEDKRVNGSYRYVSHDAVTKALHDPCVKHGLVIVPSVESYEMDTVESITKEGKPKLEARMTMNLTVEFINADNPTDKYQIRSIGVGLDNSDKISGKAMSYAFKMALLKAFMLESTEEDNEVSFAEYIPKKKEVTPEAAQEAGNDFKKKRSGL